jgi:Zn-dependent protease
LRVRLYPSRYVEDTIGAHSVTAVLWAQVMQTVAATPERRLGATIAAYVVYLVTGARIWLAIAELSAFLNLFNLIPIWQLDGARGLHVLSREQRVLVLVVIAVALWATGVRLLWIVGAVAIPGAGVVRPDSRADLTDLSDRAQVLSIRIAPGGRIRLDSARNHLTRVRHDR